MVDLVRLDEAKHSIFGEMIKYERQMRYSQSVKKFEENWEKAKKCREELSADKEKQTIQKIIKKIEGTEKIKEFLKKEHELKKKEKEENMVRYKENYNDVLAKKQ